MGSLLSLLLLINVVIFFIPSSTFQSTETEDSLLINRLLREHAVRSYTKHNKTGFLYSVHIPPNLFGVRADTVRFRCGSLRRYGAQVKEFSIAMGVEVKPCVERVLMVRQNLGEKWSSVYYQNYNVSGYQLVSPILGLVAYDATNLSSSSPSEVLIAGNKPITIDFSNVTKLNGSTDARPLCARFESNGKVSISHPVWSKKLSSKLCITMKNGHFGLVIETPIASRTHSGKVSRSKLIIGSLFGGVLGALLLGLLCVALVVKAKKKSQMEEMERRAYEEEALQISMVGHVRAPTAPGTRTLPILEHEFTAPRVTSLR